MRAIWTWVSGLLLGAIVPCATVWAAEPKMVEVPEIVCATKSDQARGAFNRAIQVMSQGKIDEAMRLYRRAIELDPRFCDAMDNLGVLLRRQGKIDEAIGFYRRSIAVNRMNPVARTDLAVALYLQGKREEAIGEYEALITLRPDDPEGYYNLAMIQLDMRHPAAAIALLEKAERLYAARKSPLITDAQFMLGVAHHDARQCEKAEPYLKKVAAEPEYAERARSYLARCGVKGQVGGTSSRTGVEHAAQDRHPWRHPCRAYPRGT
jgi:tetratricopeptide (TPR) repeat protein